MTTALSRQRRITLEVLGPPGLDVAIALLVAVPPLVCLLWLGGPPDSWPAWVALLGPIAAAAAVLACRRDLRLAVVLLTLALLCVPAADGVYQFSGAAWADVVSLAPVVAVAAVYCALGLAMDLVPSLLWLAGSTAVSWWALGSDATYLLLGVGWWAIGRVLRSRQELVENLRVRAMELTVERDRFTAEAIRQERATIARELHDVVAHCMTVIVIQSRAGQHLLGRDPGAAREAMTVILAAAAEAEADIVALVALMEPDRTRRLTRELLQELVSRAAGTGAAITAEIGVDPDVLPDGIAIAAHRLVQEAITNAFRHAPGAAITVHLGVGGVVVTNGPAPAAKFPVPGQDDDRDSLARSGTGRGLLGLRERIEGAGGRVSWGPTPAGGWRVAATLPDHPDD